jgi:hypothetical protein
LFRAVYGKIIDDMLLNPAITTRVAQGLNAMGAKTGQTITRKLIRNIGIQQLSK